MNSAGTPPFSTPVSCREAWATVRPFSRGTTHRALLAVVPATDWAGAGAGAAGAGAGADRTGAATGLGTGGGLCRSGADAHAAPATPGNGVSGAPPAAPVASSCLKQSTA